MAEDVPKRMLERMPEDTPKNVRHVRRYEDAEDMPESMSEDMPEKCQKECQKTCQKERRNTASSQARNFVRLKCEASQRTVHSQCTLFLQAASWK